MHKGQFAWTAKFWLFIGANKLLTSQKGVVEGEGGCGFSDADYGKNSFPRPLITVIEFGLKLSLLF